MSTDKALYTHDQIEYTKQTQSEIHNLDAEESNGEYTEYT